MKKGRLDRRITFMRPATGTDPDYNTPLGGWEPVVTVMAEVQDALPSRAERLADGINLAARPARIRMLYRDGITSDMRVLLGDRTLQIVAGPAELGRRDGLELMAEEISTIGDES